MKKILLLFLLGFLTFSCKDDNDVYCTEEFRTITLEIKGPTLDSFHTIRLSNYDTLKYEFDFGWSGNFYPLIDDNYKDKFPNKTEKFLFQGFINNSLVVNEEYLIYSDKCHVNYDSGNLIIQL